MSDGVIEFLKKSRELLDYCSSMDLTIRYQPKGFNYGEYRYLLQETAKELCNEAEILKVYNQGLH